MTYVSGFHDPVIPQGDLLAFGPTLLFLPLAFLGGYYFFATVWVPRLLCTFKARAWLTTWGVTLVVPAESWPEIFLIVVQFAGLALVVWSVGLPGGNSTGLTFRVPPTRGVTPFTPVGSTLVGTWLERRSSFLGTRAALLTRLAQLVLLGGASSATPMVGGKTWWTLREKLRPALLSGFALPGGNHG